jgi:hypothetical protein
MDEIKALNEKIDRLAALRRLRKEVKAKIDQKRIEFEQQLIDLVTEERGAQIESQRLEGEVLVTLRDTNNPGWKTERATVSRRTSTTYKITDEEQLMEDLKKLGIYKKYTETHVSPRIEEKFGQLELAGVSKFDKEFLTVRSKDDDEKAA